MTSSGMAVPDNEAAVALKQIKKAIRIPLVADIHFDYNWHWQVSKTAQTRYASILVTLAGPDRVKKSWKLPEPGAYLSE